MKSRIAALAATLCLVACGNDQENSESSSLSPTPTIVKTVEGQDAKTMFDIIERAGIKKQSSIESTFVDVGDAFCLTAGSICQFAVGNGGLFVRANAADSATFIGILRKVKAVSKAVNNGRRWDLKALSCNSHFDIAVRQLVTTCTFRQ